jgi:4-amino-4-deoxy-L-arabinose transferase-like glycosyltransferase
MPPSRISRLASLIDRKPELVLPAWIAAYLAVLWRAAHEPFKYDELFTYYTSTSATLTEFAGRAMFDVNPPLSYLFVRLSIVLFGDSPFAARLPSLVGFLAAGLMMYFLVKRRLGGGLGLAALGIFWSSSLTVYAIWARPYGLMLALFCMAMMCWLNAVRPGSSSGWHVGLGVAIGGMFLTHCFSPPFAAAIGVGELVRSIVSRKVDKKVWAALLLPLSVLPFYIPLVRNSRGVLYPHVYVASAITIPKVYLAILAPLAPAIFVILLIWFAGRAGGGRLRWRELTSPHEIAFAVAALLAPLVTICYCISNSEPFWVRYAIGAIVGATLLLAGLLAAGVKGNSNRAVAAACLILILFCATRAGTGILVRDDLDASTAYRTTRPDLPFVTAGGMTFLEMDQREAPGFTGRLYYLTDRESAVRNHSTIFEEVFPPARKWFPIRAKIEPYREFVTRNHEFLVLGTRGFPEDWLLQKLEQDGARITLLEELKTGYQDRELYQVTVGGSLPAVAAR